MRRRTFAAFLTGIAFTFGMITLIGAGGTVKSPTGTAPDRYVYYPGTEELGKDEIRLIAAGTGMPGARRGQAATCFLVELGDG
jgi:ribonuclease Z